MSEKEKIILDELASFKRKSILVLLYRGLLIVSAVLASLFLVFNYLEYTFQFGVNVRTFLFFTFIISTGFLLYSYIARPFYKLIHIDKAIDDESAARSVGNYFPEISDRLLNVIQLRTKLNPANELGIAGINQKIEQLPHFEFTKAVSHGTNKKLLPYILVPLLVLAAVLIFRANIITDSSERIIQFNKEFVPQAPFEFQLINESLDAFRNEDFTVQLTMNGNAIPETVYINTDGRKLRMNKTANGDYAYAFKKIQKNTTFKFEAAGFYSSAFTINMLVRPDLRNFNMEFEYPKYINRNKERVSNVGHAIVPEGTSIKWLLSAPNTNKATFNQKDETFEMNQVDTDLFSYQKQFFNAATYNIELTNQHGKNKDAISYGIDVIKDEYPRITNASFQDTVLYSFIGLGGSLADDYGITALNLYYSVDNQDFIKKSITIPFGQNTVQFYYQWSIDSLINNGQELSYYLQVWDNDGVNGRKSSKTGIYNFKIPSKTEVKEEIEKVAKQTESDIDKTIKEAKELKDELEEAERRIKGKKELNWQDDKLLKDLIKKREELNEAIEELKEQNRNNESKRQRFNEQDKKIQEKVEQLQNLMDELLDEETKKLYDELKKLLEEQSDIEDIQDLVEKLNKNESNLEQELERTLELFKRMKFEFELNESISDLKDQIDEQESLMRETEKAKSEEGEKYEQENGLEENTQSNNTENKNKDSNNLANKQSELQEKFKQLEESLKSLNEQNQSLKNPQSLPDTQEEQELIKDNQEKSKENLQNQDTGKSKQNQQNATDAMKQMAEKLQQMQAGMEMQTMQANLDDLRAIVHNLIRLSFDQEQLMNNFEGVKQSDPRFIELSQQQLKLKDDSQIVQDSLLALANRVFQIASFVTREVTEMNEHMDKAVENIRERKKPQAIAEQQFAMTSMNNLALLLDDVLQQMQDAMADAMGMSMNKGNQKAPSLSELQQQLNNKIEDLKGSGKSGRQLSEELAKLAAEQERIRKALEEAQKKAGESGNGNQPGDGVLEKMEETEIDLVNKQLTEETIRRQKEILTRLLEAEDALRERDIDEERKGETAKDYNKVAPAVFEEYFKLKQQEIEYLKTIPPKLYPYYKNEVNEYFKRIGTE